MLTLEEARQSDPKLASLSDDELKKAIADLYELADIALDSYVSEMSRLTHTHQSTPID